MASARTEDSQALIVSVAGERLAIPATSVAEVIRTPAITRLPLSPPGFVGVANLRGTVIPILSFAEMLGKPPAFQSAGRVIVVGDGSPVGLAVDEASSLQSLGSLQAEESAVRTVDVEHLIAAKFGGMSKPTVSVSTAMAREPQADTTAIATEAFFTFEVAGQDFGLPVESVREVIAIPPSVAVVPQTDDAMLGVVTLRNQLLPLVSLGALLGLGHSGAGAAARIVVASMGGVRFGLVVDAVRAIVRVSRDQIDDVPQVLTRGKQEAQIRAICRLDGGARLLSILSTDHLLKDGLAERLAAEASQQEDEREEAVATAETEQFVVFQLGGEDYGLPIASVSEVVSTPDKLTKLPKAPPFVDGVMNLRGTVVPVIDQRRRFAVGSGPASKSRVIIVRLGSGLAGFVVDAVSEVLTVSADRLHATPEISAKDSGVIDRIANLEHAGRIILLVDPQALLDRAEQDMIAAMSETASATS